MDTSPRDMVWNEFIREQFGLVYPFTTDESELYGPCNALLDDLFPVSEHYQVSPQFKPNELPGLCQWTSQFFTFS